MVEIQAGDYVVGEVIYMTDFDVEVHLGVVHQLQKGIPFSYDPGRLHRVTDWRQRRAVLRACSFGMENHHLETDERANLEVAGFPIFLPEEEGFYPQVNSLQVETLEDGGIGEYDNEEDRVRGSPGYGGAGPGGEPLRRECKFCGITAGGTAAWKSWS